MEILYDLVQRVEIKDEEGFQKTCLKIEVYCWQYPVLILLDLLKNNVLFQKRLENYTFFKIS